MGEARNVENDWSKVGKNYLKNDKILKGPQAGPAGLRFVHKGPAGLEDGEVRLGQV